MMVLYYIILDIENRRLEYISLIWGG